MTADDTARGAATRLPAVALVLAVAACVVGGTGIGLAVMQKRAAAAFSDRLEARALEFAALSNRVDRWVAAVDGIEKLVQAADAKQRAFQALCSAVEKQATALRDDIVREQSAREEFEEPVRKGLAALNSRLVELDDRLSAPRQESRAESSSPAETATPAIAPVSDGEYLIQSGDTLEKVAKKYGVGTADILRANPDVDPMRLRIGQKVRLPGRGDGVME